MKGYQFLKSVEDVPSFHIGVPTTFLFLMKKTTGSNLPTIFPFCAKTRQTRDQKQISTTSRTFETWRTYILAHP